MPSTEEILRFSDLVLRGENVGHAYLVRVKSDAKIAENKSIGMRGEACAAFP